MEFKNKTQAREVAASILQDMPIETLKTAVRRMNVDHFNDREAYPSFVEWLLDALEWRIEWEALMHAWEASMHANKMAEMTRAQEKAQERIDEALENSAP